MKYFTKGEAGPGNRRMTSLHNVSQLRIMNGDCPAKKTLLYARSGCQEALLPNLAILDEDLKNAHTNHRDRPVLKIDSETSSVFPELAIMGSSWGSNEVHNGLAHRIVRIGDLRDNAAMIAVGKDPYRNDCVAGRALCRGEILVLLQACRPVLAAHEDQHWRRVRARVIDGRGLVSHNRVRAQASFLANEEMRHHLTADRDQARDGVGF